MKAIFFFVVPAFFLSGTCFAQPTTPGSCDAVLILQSSRETLQESTTAAMLKVVNEETFHRLQLQIEAGADIPILEFIVSAQGSYRRFDEARTKYFMQQQSDLTVERAREEVKSFLTPEQIQAWSKCKEAEARAGAQANGFSAQVEHSDADNVIVAFRWAPPPVAPDTKATVTKSDVQGAHAVGLDIERGSALPQNATFRPLETRRVRYVREKGKAFSLFVDTDGGPTDPLTIAAAEDAQRRVELSRGGELIINASLPVDQRQITVPWGTTDDWNILLSPSRSGLG